MTKKIETFLFQKNFKQVEKQIKLINQQKLSLEQKLLIDFTLIKIYLQKSLQKKNSSSINDHNYHEKIREIYSRYFGKIDPTILDIHNVGMEGFLLEIGYKQLPQSEISNVHNENNNNSVSHSIPNDSSSHFASEQASNSYKSKIRQSQIQKKQKQFLIRLSKLPNLSQIFSSQSTNLKNGSSIKNNATNIKQQEHHIQNLCHQSPYFCISLLQIYTKRSIGLCKQKLANQVYILTRLIQKYHIRYASENVQNVFKKLYTISMHLLVHCSTVTHSHSELITMYIQKSYEQLQGKNRLMSGQIVVVFLYNCLKIMLGFTFIPKKVQQSLDNFYRLFQLSPCKNYSTHILQIFFIIKILIFKTGQQQQNRIEEMLIVKPNSQHSFSNKQQQAKQLQKEQRIVQNFRISQLSEKFSSFLNINLDQIIVELNQITRAIIRYKVASLATIIGVKLGIRRFSKDFLEVMHDSSFSNDIQTIKLCFQLFEFSQFEKLQYLLQIVLAVPVNISNSVQGGSSTTASNQRQVMIAMCGIFNGLYLQNRQQGLLYCKLNHKNYLALSSVYGRNKSHHLAKQLLKQQTLLEHVGFGYYNLAKQQIYLQNKVVYITKALENFEKSYRINSENYLLNYCIAKIYLKLYDYQNAYKYAMQSCKSHRGSWAPFCLLACVYMCQRKTQKAIILIDQILKKYQDTAILHYVRAYLEVNKLLLEVENDEQIQASKILGEQFYFSHYERILKSKSFHNVVKYCQNYYQLSMGHPLIDTDENFFSPQNISLEICEGQEYLLKIIRLLTEIGQLSPVENILKLMPHHNPAAMLSRGILHERRKQYTEAKQYYREILNIDPCYYDALIKLALLQLRQPETYNRPSIVVEHEQNGHHLSTFLPKQQQNLDKTRKLSINNASLYLQVANKFVHNNQYILAKGLLLSKMGMIKQGNQLLLRNCQTAWCDDLPDLLYYY